jgi:hypothetical protein
MDFLFTHRNVHGRVGECGRDEVAVQEIHLKYDNIVVPYVYMGMLVGGCACKLTNVSMVFCASLRWPLYRE